MNGCDCHLSFEYLNLVLVSLYQTICIEILLADNLVMPYLAKCYRLDNDQVSLSDT